MAKEQLANLVDLDALAKLLAAEDNLRPVADDFKKFQHETRLQQPNVGDVHVTVHTWLANALRRLGILDGKSTVEQGGDPIAVACENPYYIQGLKQAATKVLYTPASLEKQYNDLLYASQHVTSSPLIYVTKSVFDDAASPRTRGDHVGEHIPTVTLAFERPAIIPNRYIEQDDEGQKFNEIIAPPRVWPNDRRMTSRPGGFQAPNRTWAVDLATRTSPEELLLSGRFWTESADPNAGATVEPFLLAAIDLLKTGSGNFWNALFAKAIDMSQSYEAIDIVNTARRQPPIFLTGLPTPNLGFREGLQIPDDIIVSSGIPELTTNIQPPAHESEPSIVSDYHALSSLRINAKFN